MLEKQVQSQCLDWLKWHKKVAFCWRNNAGVMIIGKGRNTRKVQMSPKGTSDIIGFLKDGRFLAVEIKRPEYYKDGRLKDPQKKLSDSQVMFLKLVHKSGGIALCVSTLEELQKDFKNIILKT